MFYWKAMHSFTARNGEKVIEIPAGSILTSVRPAQGLEAIESMRPPKRMVASMRSFEFGDLHLTATTEQFQEVGGCVEIDDSVLLLPPNRRPHLRWGQSQY